MRVLDAPKPGVLLFRLLQLPVNKGPSVDFCVQSIQQEPEELLRILLTEVNTEMHVGMNGHTPTSHTWMIKVNNYLNGCVRPMKCFLGFFYTHL